MPDGKRLEDGRLRGRHCTLGLRDEGGVLFRSEDFAELNRMRPKCLDGTGWR
jgi:hypothetical protein